MGCHEKFRLFVFEFERVTQGRPSDDSNDNRRHGSRTKSGPSIKTPSRLGDERDPALKYEFGPRDSGQ